MSPRSFGSVRVTLGRIEADLNEELAAIIPVVYGALLSYAMYVLAQLMIEFVSYQPAIGSHAQTGISLEQFWPATVLFLCMAVFVAQDLGGIVKLGKVYPFKRTSRYSHELIVAFWYVASFALVGALSSLSIATFGLAIIWGGIWCNQLKEEYSDDGFAVEYAKTLRNLHYFGGALFIGLDASFLIRHNRTTLMPHIAICVVTLFVVWLFVFALYCAYKHGPDARGLIVNTIIPDRLMVTVQERLKKR